VSYTDAPHQVNLNFVCKTSQITPFLGQAAYEQRRDAANGPYLCHLVLEDSLPMLHHNEPVLRNGNTVGFVTSGAYAYHSQAAVAVCLLQLPEGTNDKQWLAQGQYQVRIEGQDYAAKVSLTPNFDPGNQRLKA